jgi:hypothetical protein
MMRELSSLWHSLEDAEYLHLLLEPVPLFGLAFGLMFLIAATALRAKLVAVIALIVIAVSCLSVHEAVQLRIKAEPRVLALQDAAFHPLIKQQTERRSSTTWIYYSIASVCVLAIALGRGSRGVVVGIVTIVVCSAGLMHALWLHKKECEVYHRNIVKYEPVR